MDPLEKALRHTYKASLGGRPVCETSLQETLVTLRELEARGGDQPHVHLLYGSRVFGSFDTLDAATAAQKKSALILLLYVAPRSRTAANDGDHPAQPDGSTPRDVDPS